MRLIPRISCSKVLLWLSNIALFGCACALLAAGGLLYVDQRKQLISKLLTVTNEFLSEYPKPLFYYVALALVGCGLIGLLAGIVGLWTNCFTNYCTLTLYFLLVFILLIGEFVISLSVVIWPNCLGLSLDEDEMVRALTGQYGIPGHEQFTAGLDLVQSQFECCGMSSNINYDTSHWILQGYFQKDLVVPLSCCVLDNGGDEDSYLDPKPVNLTLCQALQRSEYSKVNGRHTKPCLQEIRSWYQGYYLIFLGMSSTLALVNFFVLLTVINSCTNLKRQRRDSIEHHIAEFERKVNHRRNILPAAGSSTRSSPILQDEDGGRDSEPPIELNNAIMNPRNISTFRNSTNSRNRIDYKGSKSYLVIINNN